MQRGTLIDQEVHMDALVLGAGIYIGGGVLLLIIILIILFFIFR